MNFIQKSTEADKAIEQPGDTTLNFHVGEETTNEEVPFQIKLPLFSSNEGEDESQSEPFKINLSAALNPEDSESKPNDDPPFTLKIPIIPENPAPENSQPQGLSELKGKSPLKSSTGPSMRRSSPEKKLGDGSLSKSHSEKALPQKREQMQEQNSPKSLLRRAKSALGKAPTKTFGSLDDSVMNYNRNPLDYIFPVKPLAVKSEAEKVKEAEDIPAPGEVKKPKLQEIKSPSAIQRRLSNSLAVSISPKAKDSIAMTSSGFSLKPHLTESAESGLKKYKVVMLSKTVEGY